MIPRETFDEIERLVNLGQVDEAKTLLLPLVERYDDMGVWHNLGIVHMQKGEWEDSVKCYNRALEFNPAFENCTFNLACCLFNWGEENQKKGLTAEAYEKKDSAITQLRRVIAYNNHNHMALLQAGEISHSLGKYRDAAEFFDRYMDLFPHKRPVMLPKVVTCLQWAEAMMPDNCQIKLDLADRLEELGNFKDETVIQCV